MTMSSCAPSCCSFFPRHLPWLPLCTTKPSIDGRRHDATIIVRSAFLHIFYSPCRHRVAALYYRSHSKYSAGYFLAATSTEVGSAHFIFHWPTKPLRCVKIFSFLYFICWCAVRIKISRFIFGVRLTAVSTTTIFRFICHHNICMSLYRLMRL